MKLKITYPLSCDNEASAEELRDAAAEAADSYREQTKGFRHIDTEVQEVGDSLFELVTRIEVSDDQAMTFDFSAAGDPAGERITCPAHRVASAVALRMGTASETAIEEINGSIGERSIDML